MRKKDRHILLAGLVVLVLAGVTLWQWGYGRPVRWGRGPLTVSERAWHEARLKRLGNLWQELAFREPRDDEGRIVQPYETYLVADLRRRALWIEDKGQIIEASRYELPGQMTWEAQFADPNGTRKLGDLIRLQWRGTHPHERPELLALVGYSQNGEYSAFSFSLGVFWSLSHGTGPFTLNWRARAVAGEEYYDSMLVENAEYERVRRTKTGAAPETVVRRHVTEVHTGIAPWLAMEQKLYQAIEEQVGRTGFDLRKLTVKSGPDYLAGQVEIQADNYGFLTRLFHRVSYAEAYLRIDHLEEGVWYVWTDPNRRRPSSRSGVKQLKFEFVVSGGKPLSKAEQRGWVRQGRARQKDLLRMPDRRKVRQREWIVSVTDGERVPPRWRIELASGVTFELVGIRGNSGAGKPWWGPDGTPLARAPCVLPEQAQANRPESTSCDVVWRTLLPAVFLKRNRGIEEVKFEGCVSSSYQSIPDYRYRNDEPGGLHTGLTAATCQFEQGREQTTLTLGLDLGGRRPIYIRFENISLVPNRDFGFRIEQVQ